MLIERLQESRSDDDYFRWLLFLVGFYRGEKKNDSAAALLRRFLQSNATAEQKTHCFLALGQIATDDERFELAISHFSYALAQNPSKKKLVYILYNNLGYCCNSLGRYAEGERYCRLAIEINSIRAAAYRNLGVSRQGQGDGVGAAWALVEAIKVDSCDKRALYLLQKLVRVCPPLLIQCPWIVEVLGPEEAPRDGTPPI